MAAKSDSDVERALKAFGDLSLKYRSFGAIPLRLGQSLLMGSDPRIGDFADMPIGPAADLPPTNAADAFPLLGSALSEAREVPVAAKYAPSAAAERWGGAAPAAPSPRMNLAAQALAKGRRTDPAVQSMPDTATLPESRTGWANEPLPAVPAAEAEPPRLAPGPVVIRPSTDPGYEPDSFAHPPARIVPAASVSEPIFEAPDFQSGDFKSGGFQPGSFQPASFQSYAAPQSYAAAAFEGQQAPPPYVEPVAPATGEPTVAAPAVPPASRPGASARPPSVARAAIVRTGAGAARPPLAGLFRALGGAKDGTSDDVQPPRGPDGSAD